MKHLGCSCIDTSGEQAISRAIQEIEQHTTAEVHVHLASGKIKEDALVTAQKIFYSLGLQHTPHRNCVLILVAFGSQKVAIYGDEGINRILGQNGWGKIINKMIDSFKGNRFVEGITEAVWDVGRILIKHYPRSQNNDKPNYIDDQPTRS